MSQEFKNIKVGNGKRSTFDLSHDQVTTSDFGKIIPIFMRECVPGDKWNIDPNVFIRLAPLAVPTYGRIKCRVHTFFVPNRIMWSDWDNWIVGNSQSAPPYFSAQRMGNWLYADKAFNPSSGNPERGLYCDVLSNLGLNPFAIARPAAQGEEGSFVCPLGNSFKVNAFPFLAYQRIWFDYFRDSNLNTSETWFDQFTHGGFMSDIETAYLMARKNACYKKDYFTTAKLNPQDGSAGASAGVVNSCDATSSGNVLYNVDDRSLLRNQGGTSFNISQSISVAALRAATALQRYFERDNYVGSRTISRLLAHFGVQPSAERLDMAEYVGGSDFNVQIADVTSTSQYTQSSPWGTTGLGSQAGKGIGAGSIKSCEYFCKEHGILMSVMSILPDTGYYQGVSKLWSRGFNGDGKLEYYSQEFENLGFQPILNREIYVPRDNQYSNYDPSGVFGYNPRYSDYKFQGDVLAGDFVNAGTSASGDAFHLFRKLYYDNNHPIALNENFTMLANINNDYDRIFQVTDNKLDHFYCNVHVKAIAERPMVDFVEPSIADVQEGEGRKVELPYGGIRL